MKTVKKINNNILIIILGSSLICCKHETNIKDKGTNLPKDTIPELVYNYDNIVTNRKDDNFVWELISTLPVKEGDTVLFNKENIIGDNYFKTTIRNSSSVYEISPFDNLNYYKTGENKFSSFKIKLKDEKGTTNFNFYTSVNYHELGDPYGVNNMSGLVDIVKVNDSVAKFDVFYPNLLEYDIYFKINENNTLDIFKIFIKDNWEDKAFNYQLDTLININKNNKYIPLLELAHLTTQEKNLIE